MQIWPTTFINKFLSQNNFTISLLFSMAALMLQRHLGSCDNDCMPLQSLKYLLSDPLQKGFACPVLDTILNNLPSN